MKKKLKRDLMENRVKKAKKMLTEISHLYIRKRDSIKDETKKGYCCCCKKLAEGMQFQCGHWIPDSVGGALLRYHPHNMHGQCGSCNCRYQQEQSKIDYSIFMTLKYGIDYIEKLRQLKNKTIKADIIFYEMMIELYGKGNEEDIIKYLTMRSITG